MSDTTLAVSNLDRLSAYAARKAGPPGRPAVRAVVERQLLLERVAEEACELRATNERQANAIAHLDATLRSAQHDLAAERARSDFLASEADTLRVIACMGESTTEQLLAQRDRLAGELQEARADAEEWGSLASEYARLLDARTLWFEVCAAAIVVSTALAQWCWPQT